MSISGLKSLNLNKKRVFLRADFNIPCENGQILQDFKLQASKPTIDKILQAGSKIILGTHIGRPDLQEGKNYYEENLSTKILIPWFKKNGYSVTYEIDLMRAIQLSKTNFSDILLLENLRFFSGEKESSLNFAEILASMADIYVNDAFGSLHRNNTSITLLAQQFSRSNRAFGLLVEKEFEMLEKIRQNHSQNFVVVIGGIKLKDKIPMLEHLKPKAILLGGGLAMAFLKNQGLQIGNLDIDQPTLDMAEKINQYATSNKIKILLPCDQVTSEDGQIKTVDIENISSESKCIDIGPKTIDLFDREIKKSELIFFNGTMGIYTDPAAQNGTRGVLQSIANSNAFSVVGGGDAVASVCMFNLEEKFNFLSTGGGATLKYLGCTNPEQEMPGIQAMLYE